MSKTMVRREQCAGGIALTTRTVPKEEGSDWLRCGMKVGYTGRSTPTADGRSIVMLTAVTTGTSRQHSGESTAVRAGDWEGCL